MKYRVLTWDCELQQFTPQTGMNAPCIDVPLQGVRAALKELRARHGYTCHRTRAADGSHDDNDFSVLVEQTNE